MRGEKLDRKNAWVKGSSGPGSWFVWVQGQRDNFALGYSLTLYQIQSELSADAEGQKCHFYGVLYPQSLFFVIDCVYQCCNRALKS